MDIMNNGDYCASDIARHIILPPSFISGPRDMKKRYVNTMALVQRYGKPDIFLIITCNTNWAEIKQELAEGELAQDRLDLVSRIFRAKLVALKKIIQEKKFFGEVAAMIHVIEFQKWWSSSCTLFNYFATSVEDHATTTVLSVCLCGDTNTVLPILERPCVTAYDAWSMWLFNPECPSMVKGDGKHMCRYKYPREFTTFTTHSDDGYQTYMRRDTGESVRLRGVELDNRWVIPFNPYLLAYFDCHIIVEICSSIKAVKFLFKYIL